MNEKSHDRQRKQTLQERPPVPSIDTQDRVDEASYDSFPASDPPAHNASRATPDRESKPVNTPAH